MARLSSEENKRVYQNFNFDGFHVDQLGSAPGYHVMENGHKVEKASRLSTKDGKEVLLWDGYSPLLTKLHNDQKDKELVMNQVSNWGHTVVATNPNYSYSVCRSVVERSLRLLATI